MLPPPAAASSTRLDGGTFKWYRHQSKVGRTAVLTNIVQTLLKLILQLHVESGAINLSLTSKHAANFQRPVTQTRTDRNWASIRPDSTDVQATLTTILQSDRHIVPRHENQRTNIHRYTQMTCPSYLHAFTPAWNRRHDGKRPTLNGN